MSSVDPDRVATLMRDVAASAILPRYRKLGVDDIKEKGPSDLVTVADTEAERLLTTGLVALLPGSVVVGEEAVAADSRALAPLDSDAPVWIVDPVDGTLAFAHGEPDFSVIVALVRNGRTLAGWLLDPLRDRLAIAEVGQGAWMAGERLRVAADGPLASMSGAVWGRPAIANLSGKIRSARPWSSGGLVYMALAEGRLDFALFRWPKPWDHAAGVLIHMEAGGTAALLDGSPYRPLSLDRPLLAAPGPQSWEALRPLAEN